MKETSHYPIKLRNNGLVIGHCCLDNACVMTTPPPLPPPIIDVSAVKVGDISQAANALMRPLTE